MGNDTNKKNAHGQIIKRLTLKIDTLRELYLKSGNVCAFPGCTKVMINKEGVWVGQICHIEAAEFGGQRFNPHKKNEDNRHFSNLILMCYEHHAITNDVNIYSVEVLKKMKADHEAKFTDILKRIMDHTAVIKPNMCQSLKGINSILNWNLTDDQLKMSIPEVEALANNVCNLPINTREFLVIIVNRLKNIPMHPKANKPIDEYDVFFNPVEIELACQISKYDFKMHMDILSDNKVGSLIHDDFHGTTLAKLYKSDNGWFIFRRYSKVLRKGQHSNKQHSV